MADGPDNPFEYGRELGPGELADRADEVAEVATALVEGSKHFLIGPRRYGKSSVHNVGAHLARKKGALVLRYNVQAFTRLEDLAGAIVADSAKLVKGPVAKVADGVGKFFRELRPVLSYNAVEQSWAVTLGAVGERKPVPLLVDALHGLERLAASEKRPLGLILDEFQQVVAPGGHDAEALVRAAVQEHRKVGYVFAGSDTRMLAAMTSDPARPLYRLGSGRFLSLIPRPAFTSYMRERFAQLKAKVSDEAIAAILEEADDVPYNVQLLAHQCWNALRDRHPPALGAEDVATIHVSAARRLDPVYSEQWLGLSGAQRRALQALIALRGDGLYSAAATAKFQLSASAMQGAVEGLTEKRVCWRQNRNGESRIRLEDPLFGVWVRAYTK
jgi:hypothetical protein